MPKNIKELCDNLGVQDIHVPFLKKIYSCVAYTFCKYIHDVSVGQHVVLRQWKQPNLLVLIWHEMAANFSVTKMQEENSIIQSPCFFELGDKFVAHLMPN
jgi:hypothetical protein